MIVERPILHHSIIVSINGESFRLKDKRKAGLFGSPARIARRQRTGRNQCFISCSAIRIISAYLFTVDG